MNTIPIMHGQNLAMDGQPYIKFDSRVKVAGAESAIPTGTEVAQTLSDNLAEAKENAEQLQRLSNMIMGQRSLRFSVNKDLGEIVISVLDPLTNKVIKQIPSEDIQQMKISMKKAIGVLFDEMI